jgi:hypothetical protein
MCVFIFLQKMVPSVMVFLKNIFGLAACTREGKMCGDKQLIPEHPVTRHNAGYIQNQGSSFRRQLRTTISEYQVLIYRKKGTLIHGDKHNTKVTNPTTSWRPSSMYFQEGNPKQAST